jgi:hypothetical protein
MAADVEGARQRRGERWRVSFCLWVQVGHDKREKKIYHPAFDISHLSFPNSNPEVVMNIVIEVSTTTR